MARKRKTVEIYQCSVCGYIQERHPMFITSCESCGRVNVIHVVNQVTGDWEFWQPNPYALPKMRKSKKPLPGQLSLFDTHQDGTQH